MELSPAYCDVIAQRWEQFTGKKAERVAGGNGGEVTDDEHTPAAAAGVAGERGQG